MRWEDAYDIRPSVNTRGEKTYDIFRKDTEDMLWSDIPVDNIDNFLKGLVAISELAAREEVDNLLSGEET